MRFLKFLSVSLSFLFALNAQAATVFNVSGINNLEWLDLTATAGMSRLQVEDTLVAGGALEGWRYATRSEVESLYDSLWGGTVDGYAANNFAGARIFFDAFGIHSFFGVNGYDELGSSSWYTVFGAGGECGISADESCQGLVAIYDMNYGASLNAGYFHDDFGLSTGTDSINNQSTISNLYGYPHVGSHLVRELLAVPLPAAVWLFGSGLLAMCAMTWRKHK